MGVDYYHLAKQYPNGVIPLTESEKRACRRRKWEENASKEDVLRKLNEVERELENERREHSEDVEYWKSKQSMMRIATLEELNESYLQTINDMEKKIKDLEEQIKILKTIR